MALPPAAIAAAVPRLDHGVSPSVQGDDAWEGALLSMSALVALIGTLGAIGACVLLVWRGVAAPSASPARTGGKRAASASCARRRDVPLRPSTRRGQAREAHLERAELLRGTLSL